MKILFTGNAGFIGFHTAKKLLERGDHVVGLDNVNDYYDVKLKHARLKELEKTAAAVSSQAPVSSRAQRGISSCYEFIKADLADRAAIEKVFKEYQFDRVIHLAAQPGVRYSLTHPHAYTASNIEGFLNILEGCRNTKMPYPEHDGADHPLSLYGATKRANELMAHSYSDFYGLPVTGLRFFTVYRPWGRPDMSPIPFTQKILAGERIPVFNHGNHSRDFTYIDDIVEGVIRASDLMYRPATPVQNGVDRFVAWYRGFYNFCQ